MNLRRVVAAFDDERDGTGVAARSGIVDDDVDSAGPGDSGIVENGVEKLLGVGVNAGIGGVRRVEDITARAEGYAASRRGAEDGVEGVFADIGRGQGVVVDHVERIGCRSGQSDKTARHGRKVADPHAHGGVAGATETIGDRVGERIHADKVARRGVAHDGALQGDDAARSGRRVSNSDAPGGRRARKNGVVRKHRQQVVKAVARDGECIVLRHGRKLIAAVLDAHADTGGRSAPRVVGDLVGKCLDEFGRRHRDGPVDERETVGRDHDAAAGARGVGADSERGDCEHLVHGRQDAVVERHGQCERTHRAASHLLIEHGVVVGARDKIAPRHGDRDLGNIGRDGIGHRISEALLAEETFRRGVDKLVVFNDDVAARARGVPAGTDRRDGQGPPEDGEAAVVGKDIEHVVRAAAKHAEAVRIGVGTGGDGENADRAGGQPRRVRGVRRDVLEVRLPDGAGRGEAKRAGSGAEGHRADRLGGG